MNKNWIIATLMAGLCLQAASAQGSFQIGNQSHVVCTGSPAIVLQNVGFENNGNFEAGESALYFSGAPATISGNTASTFFDAYLGTAVALKSDLYFEGAAMFDGGMLLPEDHTVFLEGSGSSFYFENDNSRMTGSGGGYAAIRAKLLSGGSADAGPGNLGVAVLQSEQEDYAEFRRGYATALTPAGNSIARWYEILPGYNQNLNARLRFWYLDVELGGLDENELVVWRSDDGGNSWSPLATEDRNTEKNWVEIAQQDELARYTLAGPAGILPLGGHFSDRLSSTPAMSLEVFPNPVSEVANIRIDAGYPTSATLRWQDATGRILRTTPIVLHKGRNDFSEPVHDLPAGVWFVSVNLPGAAAIRVIKE